MKIEGTLAMIIPWRHYQFRYALVLTGVTGSPFEGSEQCVLVSEKPLCLVGDRLCAEVDTELVDNCWAAITTEVVK